MAHSFSDVWASWSPKAYLHDYHSTVKDDTRLTMSFLIDVVDRYASDADRRALLEVGCGPVLYGPLAIARYFSDVYLSDLLLDNLSEIDAWLRHKPGMFDWSEHSRVAVELSGTSDSGEAEAAVRQNVRALITCDLRDELPLGQPLSHCFPTVMALYCADSASTNTGEWTALMRRVVSLIQPRGLCLFAALIGATRYRCGNQWFPSAGLSAVQITSFFDDASFSTLAFETAQVREQTEQGYGEIALGCFRSGVNA